MTTFSTLTEQRISSQTLHELLGTEGPAYEAIGSGITQALACIQDARDFYALPSELDLPLDRLTLQLRQALITLQEAKQQMS